MIANGTIVNHAIVYMLIRFISVLASFLLFALASLQLNTNDSNKAFFCMFILGFCIAGARMCVQVGASLNSSLRISQRYRQARRGYDILRLIIPFISFFGSVEVYFHTSNVILSIISFFVIATSAPNIDLIRGILGKTTIFSIAFLMGTLTSIALIKWVFPHTLNYIVLGFLVQWLFVSFINYKILVTFFKNYYRNRISRSYLFSVIIFAFFDGVILNAPFLLGILSSDAQAGIDLSLTIRIFIASLPIMPLLIHWTNTKYFQNFCVQHSLKRKIIFRILTLFTGIISGVVFAIFYVGIVKEHIPIYVLIYYISILIAYSVYISELRFSFPEENISMKIPAILFYILTVFFIALTMIKFLAFQLVLMIVLAQVIALLFAAGLLKKQNNAPLFLYTPKN
jgi:hypothetical protein